MQYELHNVTKSYTCDFENSYFNYTTKTKHFWCYYNETIYTDDSNTTMQSSELQLIYERDFESGDLENKIAYWNEQKEWKPLQKNLEVINYEYGGMDKWYCLDFNVTKDTWYKLKANINFKTNGFSSVPVETKNW